jgi:sigma-B regulation protein RsbU (phosphoserine phosphatase)
MGLHFIHTLMDKVERTKVGEANLLILHKHIKRGAPISLFNAKRETLELSALHTVSQVMTSAIALDDLLHIIVNKCVEIIGAERGTLYQIDESTGECWSKVLLEDKGLLPEIRLKLGQGIAGYVALTGEIVNIADAQNHPLFNPIYDHRTGYLTHSVLAVPLRNPQQKIIGVIQLLNKTGGGSFTSADARLLSAMAAQAAISIENATLYAQALEKRLLERELETALDIQRSFLPENVPTLTGWDIATYWRPFQRVAGDFYDFFPLDDGRIAFVIADVSGKGVPAALFMSLCVTVLRFGMSLNFPPDELLARANSLIIKQQRSRMFATVFVAYLDPATGQLAYANGGHNPPLHFRAGEGRAEYLKAGGVALGVFENPRYETRTLHLDPADVLVLYTDGITEIMNAKEEEYGEEALQAWVAQHAAQDANGLCALIVRDIHAFAEEASASDDETLLILKRAEILKAG